MIRREFIAGIGSAVAWPLAARAQQRGQLRRLGALMRFPSTDLQARGRIAEFKQELAKLGWIEGRNIQIEERWADPAAGLGLMQAYAAELVKLRVEVILTNGPVGVTSVLRESRSLPIVFAGVTDPVALGFVESLARPGGSVTGFALFENSVIPKFVEALREIVPNLARVALIFHPDNPSKMLHLRALDTVAVPQGLIAIAATVRNASEIEQAIEALSHEEGVGLMFPPEALFPRNRDLIVMLAARHRLPAIYSSRTYVEAGGLMSYGPDVSESYQLAAGYVDRILKGEKPGDLPVQQPSRFQFVLNLKTARAIGLEVPTSILLRADEVIE